MSEFVIERTIGNLHYFVFVRDAFMDDQITAIILGYADPVTIE